MLLMAVSKMLSLPGPIRQTRRLRSTRRSVPIQPLWIIRKMLHEVKTGWHWLQRKLNEVIRAVNQQKPLPSATIAIEESPNGTLLKVVGTPQDQPPSTTGSGSGS